MKSDKATTPIEIGLILMSVIMIYSLVELIAGSITDMFVFSLTQINMDLSPWTLGVMTPFVNSMSRAVYMVPFIIILIFIVWGARALYIKQQSFRTDTGLASSEEY